MLLDIIFSGDLSPSVILASIVASVIVVFITLPIHELAHGFAAYKLGDNTAKYARRLTINPLAHLDPLGTALIFLIGFGWAKPVPVNPRNFKNSKRDMAITAFAGPLANLIMAFLFAFFGVLCEFFIINYSATLGNQNDLISSLETIFLFAAQINVSLAVFNLIPVPPLDGSRILGAFLPSEVYYSMMQYERYFFVVIIAMVYFLDRFGISEAIFSFILDLAIFPFRFF